MSTRSSQKGVGMVEVLVALIVLAVGVLGYVMLQVRAMEATIEGTQRIQAINIARDLAERVRVNREGWVVNVYLWLGETPWLQAVHQIQTHVSAVMLIEQVRRV